MSYKRNYQEEMEFAKENGVCLWRLNIAFTVKDRLEVLECEDEFDFEKLCVQVGIAFLDLPFPLEQIVDAIIALKPTNEIDFEEIIKYIEQNF